MIVGNIFRLENDFEKKLGLCLVPGKYKGKKKNAKENDFLMFGYPIKNIKENQI